MLTKLVFVLLVARASCQLSKEILDIIGEPNEPEFETRSYNPGEICKRAGYSCHTCNTVINCVESLDGSLQPKEFIGCGIDETCDRNTSKCISGYNPDCHPTLRTYQFKCRQRGIFPDPFQCQRYHVCDGYSDSVSTGYMCPTGYGFDVNTLQCIVKLVNNKCERPIDPCKKNGEIGIVGGNGRMIYVCSQETFDNVTDNYPSLIHCHGNYIFVNGKCQEMAKNEEHVSGGRCMKVGDHPSKIFFQYFKCYSNGYVYLNNCNYGQYFNMKLGTCTAFNF